MRLADEQRRRRVLTDFESTLLVEAAAGTGKTSLIAGRVAMLLATGRAPQHIAAITFTELAAGELALRIRNYVSTLLSGQVPQVMALALPQGLSAEQSANLARAQQHLDEITTSTIHSFCQEMIRSYAIEAGLDPGSRVIDGPSADSMFESVFSSWLIDRLSNAARADDPVAVLSQHDPLQVRISNVLIRRRVQCRSAWTVEPILTSLRRSMDSHAGLPAGRMNPARDVF
jgi:ATP-dependent exoDNAse (exonuclease V) beta subunit